MALAEVARQTGEARVIGFDMGGTSTDVSRFDGEPERVYECEVAGVRLRAPMMRIVTVAAGGGSLCRLDASRLVVGPESAGAEPGPLCYGHPDARELTITDVNLVLGRLLPDRFALELDERRSRARAGSIGGRARCVAAKLASPEQIAEGFFHIANTNMAEAIRQISVARGYDTRDHALVVFGGAGGQHACALARRLGIERVLFHPLAGVLSAWGMGLSPVTWHADADAGRVPLTVESLEGLAPTFQRLAEQGRQILAQDGYPDADVERRVDLRYRGTESSITLRLAGASELREAFDRQHALRFGYSRSDAIVELVQARVEVLVRRERSARVPGAPTRTVATEPTKRHRMFIDGAFVDSVPVFEREALVAGQLIQGPAVILEATGTVVVDPGFSLAVRADGVLVAQAEQRQAAAPEVALVARRDAPDPDPARDHGQPVHEHRRANGSVAAPHRDQYQHPRATRLFLRGVRPRRRSWSPTRRTFRCIWAP